MGALCIVVRETPGSNPGGSPIFGPFSLRGDSLEMKKGRRGVGVRVNMTGAIRYEVMNLLLQFHTSA